MNIAIAGCGIAGMAVALLLHRQGHKVTLFERFDTPRALGSGLMIQPTGLAVLDRLGLGDRVRGEGARVDRLFGKSGDRTALDVRYAWLGRGADVCGYGIHRAALFDILHGAVIAAGISFCGGKAVAGHEEGRLCFEDGDRSDRFDLVVDAMGAMSALSPRAAQLLPYGALWASLDAVPGLSPDVLEQRYHRASIMCGVLPIGRVAADGPQKVAFFWSLRADRLEAWRTRGLEAWKDDVRALWPETAPLLDQIAEPEQLTFARYAHRTVRRPIDAKGNGRLIHIGDSWHSASPQLGQGANNALLDAWALASAIQEGGDVDAALARAVAARWLHVHAYQLLSVGFTPAYQSDGALMPFVRDWLVPLFAKVWPATRFQAEMVAGTFGAPLRRLGL